MWGKGGVEAFFFLDLLQSGESGDGLGGRLGGGGRASLGGALAGTTPVLDSPGGEWTPPSGESAPLPILVADGDTAAESPMSLKMGASKIPLAAALATPLSGPESGPLTDRGLGRGLEPPPLGLRPAVRATGRARRSDEGERRGAFRRPPPRVLAVHRISASSLVSRASRARGFTPRATPWVTPWATPWATPGAIPWATPWAIPWATPWATPCPTPPPARDLVRDRRE